MKKKLSVLVLFFSLALTAVFNVQAAQITDISDNWAQKEIQYFIDQGFIVGYGDGTFLPDKTVTRAEFVRIVNNAFKFNTPATISFSDVRSGDWFYDDVRYAVAAGFISGYANNTFRPNNNITREEVASIIQRLIKAPLNSSHAPSVYSDVLPSSHYNPYIGALTSIGVMKGVTSTSFSPKSYETRADTAYSLYNALFNGTATENSIVDGNVIVRTSSYGPSSEFSKESIPKNLYVKSSNSDTTVKNVTIQGDLVIEDTAKRVYLQNVDVKGKLIVNGGTSLNMSKCDVQNMDIDNIRERMNVSVSKDSICYNTNIYTSCYLSEDSDALSLGLSNVVISNKNNSYVTVDLSGRFVVADVYAPRTTLNLLNGLIGDLYFNSAAENSTVKLSSGTVVQNAEFNAPYVSVTGSGVITKAKVEAANVTLANVPQTLTGSYSPIYTADVDSYGLTVTVNNRSGVPVQSANVTVYGISRTTNSNGQASFSSIPNGTHNYTITRTGFDTASGTLEVTSYNTSKTITLYSTSTYTFSLMVQDSVSGASVSGATVALKSVTTQYTSSGGQATFSGLYTGVYSYTVSASGYSSATNTISINNANSSATIKLVPTTTTNHSAIFYIRDAATNALLSGTTASIAISSKTGTATNGTATIGGLTSGTHTYTVTAPGYGSFSGSATVSGNTTINVILNGECTLTVTVTDKGNNDNPIQGASVVIGSGTPVLTDASGVAKFTGLSTGTQYTVKVTNSGYDDVTETVTISGTKPQATLDVSMTSAASPPAP